MIIGSRGQLQLESELEKMEMTEPYRRKGARKLRVLYTSPGAVEEVGIH